MVRVMVKDEILRLVQADASERLVYSMGKKSYERARRAIREIVEAKLPDPRMPARRIDTPVLGVGGPHVAWRWVTPRGSVTVVAEVLIGRTWDKVALSALESLPGIKTRPTMIYRDETDPIHLGDSVDQIARHLIAAGLFNP